MIPRAITGLGIASAVGIGRQAFFEAMHTAELLADAPPARIESFDATKYETPQIAEVPNFDATRYLGEKGLRTLDRLTKLLIVSTRLALHDAGLKKDGLYVATTPDRVGICCSNAYGSLEAITELDRVAQLEDARYINPAKFPNTVSNSASGYASIWEDLRALNVAVSDGNCGGLDTVACADIYLETGRADVILVGGAEAMSEALFVAFQKLDAIDASSHKGNGTRIGEGVALLVLELSDVAKERGASILAEVIGYGTAFLPPASEALLINASTEAMQRAIASALADAELIPTDIDVIASSVSGLSLFDAKELAAIDHVFGPEVCIAAPKAILGETLGAGGGMGMAAALAWFQGAKPARIVRGKVPAKIETVLVTSIGFYGNASAVVMRRPL